MRDKATDNLSQELMNTPDIDQYIKENEPFFSNGSIAELLTEAYGSKDISKAALARAAGISEVYLHQVFAGRRCPSRDRLICICIGLRATLGETQELLKGAAFAPLYPRNKRDAIISYGIIHGTGLNEINEKLFAENEKTLS